jgi:hypothetical protein
MTNKGIATAFIASGLLLLSLPLFAHHQTAEFDTTKTVTIKGTVVEWFWANPHCLLKVAVKGDDGQIVNWVGETQAPPNIVPYGWAKQSLKPGDEVTVTLTPARNGKPLGGIKGVVFADGKKLGFGGGGNGRSPADAGSN